jgi:hypothetical protein
VPFFDSRTRFFPQETSFLPQGTPFFPQQTPFSASQTPIFDSFSSKESQAKSRKAAKTSANRPFSPKTPVLVAFCHFLPPRPGDPPKLITAY